MTQIAIVGAAGRMGQQIAQVIDQRQDATLAGAVDFAGHPAIDQAYRVGAQITAITLKSSLDAPLDVVIDFSSPKSTVETAKWCATHQVALIVGTTGLTDDEKTTVQAAGDETAVVFAPNMSVGVNVLFELVRIGAKTVGLDWEFELVEAHHRHKKDSPSGTAMRLAELMADARESTIDQLGVYARHGMIGARTKDEIGVQTIRGGDIVGEHTAYLISDGERLELTHRATDRKIFATGAVRAAVWAAQQSKGLYSMRDVLGF